VVSADFSAQYVTQRSEFDNSGTKFGRVPRRNSEEFLNEIRKSSPTKFGRVPQRNAEEFPKEILKSSPTIFGRVPQRNSAEFPIEIRKSSPTKFGRVPLSLLAGCRITQGTANITLENELHLHQASELKQYKTRLIRNGSKGNDSDTSPCCPDFGKRGKNLISSLTQTK
jgi:hypothetical protein